MNSSRREEILEKILSTENESVVRPVLPKVRQSLLDHWPLPVLLERAAYLRKLAKLGDGSASETFKEYPEHSATLIVRCRSGVAELHETTSVLFIVLEGRATLLTGGTLRGDSIEGGTGHDLRAGNVMHVAAGLPHQMLVAGENSVACLAVKIEQNP